MLVRPVPPRLRVSFASAAPVAGYTAKDKPRPLIHQHKEQSSTQCGASDTRTHHGKPTQKKQQPNIQPIHSEINEIKLEIKRAHVHRNFELPARMHPATQYYCELVWKAGTGNQHAIAVYGGREAGSQAYIPHA